MNVLPRARLESILARYDEAEELAKAKDPDSEPYRSKYAARATLQEILDSIADDLVAEVNNVRALALGAAIYCDVGCLDMDVQELSDGEANLLKCCELLEQIPEAHDDLGVLCKVKALNQLGILWCSRGDNEKAEGFLNGALEARERFKGEGARRPAYGVRNLLSAGPLQPSFDNDKSVDLATAHTFYYLAQVYQKLSRPEKSAECCHTTLKIQLELKEFEPVDWATNAGILSHHYVANGLYGAARSHLAAAELVLERAKEEEEEALEECGANVSVSWGKYALHLLEASVAEAEEGSPTTPTPPLGYDPEFSVEAPEVPSRTVSDFEGARAVFLHGQRHCNRAKAFRTFHEHCTAHVEIQQDLSRMHKALAFFEPGAGRRFKMQKRRAELLRPIARGLSPAAYKLLFRQVAFELGEVYAAMACLKIGLMDGEADSEAATAAKANALVARSAACFEAFLETLRNVDGGTMPERHSEDTCRPALLARFHLGRICGKFVSFPAATDAAVQWLVRSLANYEAVVDYCAKNPEDVKAVEAELPICRELAHLLPLKIRKLRLEMRPPHC